MWDVADYVVPPAENGAFFVATNVIITPNQTRGFCPEDNFDVKGVDCNPDPDACDAAFNAITITGKEGGTTSESSTARSFVRSAGPSTDMSKKLKDRLRDPAL